MAVYRQEKTETYGPEILDCSFHLPVPHPRPSHTTLSTQPRLKEFISYHEGTRKLPSTDTWPGAFLLRPSPKHDVCPPDECYNGREEKPKPLPLLWPDLKKKKILARINRDGNWEEQRPVEDIFPVILVEYDLPHPRLCCALAEQQPLQRSGLFHLRAIYQLQLLMGPRALSVLLAASSLCVSIWITS